MSNNIKEALFGTMYKKDGVDHIHISVFGQTQLGKYAAMGWRKKFFIPQLGEFSSALAFMSWLATGDESQRHTTTPAKMPHLTRQEYIKYLHAGYLAKWYQLTSLNKSVDKHVRLFGENNPFSLPWAEYKIHSSGLKESASSQVNANILKNLIFLNFTHGNKLGLHAINSEIIPNFNLTEVNNWINETVRKKFNLDDSEVYNNTDVEKTTEEETEIIQPTE